MSSDYLFRARLATLFFTLLSLAVTGLNAAIGRFSVVLQDRARSEYMGAARYSGGHFETLQSNILIGAVSTAVAAGAFTMYGAVVATHSPVMRRHENILPTLAVNQLILAFIMIVTGVCTAVQVQDFQNLFEHFGASDKAPYYVLMYYGSVAQAAYGSVLVLLTIICHYVGLLRCQT
jgi:hypothetical protein